MGIVAFLAATAIMAALAVPAGAKPHQTEHEPTVSAELEMRGSHGFRLGLSLGTGTTILDASRSSGEGAVIVTYIPLHPDQHAFDPYEVNARVGRLGHFRGRFVPASTETEKPFSGCKGDPTMIEKGYFVGSFNFRGERGYTAIHSHREPGTVTHQPRQTCPRRHESRGEAKETTERERNEFRLVAGDEQPHS